ncbi:MAG: PIN domain-containing protein [Hyphomicrobiales bacterium]|nr:PIN domain-containing protein [Hyphomicrobiales bacterium]
MTGPCFVDANIFIYADDPRDPRKQALAREWLEMLWNEGTGRASTQVLSEYFVTVTRKLPVRVPGDDAWLYIQGLEAWNPLPIDFSLLRRAHGIHLRYGIHWWDSLIVAAAQAQHCLLLLSEDLQDGAQFGCVTVRDPFRLSVAEAIAAYGEAPKPRYARRPSAMRAPVL